MDPTANGHSFGRMLFVSCVSPDRAHPSGRLAQKYRDMGVEVVTLFENARDPRAIWRDLRLLWHRTRLTRYNSGLINVNGSIAQLAAVTVFRLRGIPASLWIMDSYPGCLRYTTRFWRVLWLPFYFASLLVKSQARAMFVIDEAFAAHAPAWPRSIERSHYVSLPVTGFPPAQARGTKSRPTIGIVGNIEQEWLNQDFAAFFEQAISRGFRILIATSRPIDLSVAPSSDLEIISPWLKEDTDAVFSACDYLLVPISIPRLLYSSPSKIVESYSRGLQPIVMVDECAWRANRDRLVYQHCLHLTEFLAGVPPFSPTELQGFASHWTANGPETLSRTLWLASGHRR